MNEKKKKKKKKILHINVRARRFGAADLPAQARDRNNRPKASARQCSDCTGRGNAIKQSHPLGSSHRGCTVGGEKKKKKKMCGFFGVAVFPIFLLAADNAILAGGELL
jgi:hypothetical protein